MKRSTTRRACIGVLVVRRPVLTCDDAICYVDRSVGGRRQRVWCRVLSCRGCDPSSSCGFGSSGNGVGRRRCSTAGITRSALQLLLVINPTLPLRNTPAVAGRRLTPPPQRHPGERRSPGLEKLFSPRDGPRVCRCVRPAESSRRSQFEI
jgi:hypothetical protein